MCSTPSIPVRVAMWLPLCMAAGAPGGSGPDAASAPAATSGGRAMPTCAASVRPGEIPVFSLRLDVEGIPIDIDSTTCGELTPLPNGDFAWTGEYAHGDLPPLRWNLVLNPDPIITITTAITNTATVFQSFSLVVAMPAIPVTAPLCAGTVVASVIDGNGDGATLSTSGGLPLYSALLDSTLIATMLDDPVSGTTGPWGTATLGPVSFGLPGITLPAPPLTGSMGLELEFAVSPGDTATVTATFIVVP